MLRNSKMNNRAMLLLVKELVFLNKKKTQL